MRNSPPERTVSSVDLPPVERIAELRITRLFESMRPDLLRFALWLTRDRSIAEDVVQESLLRAWRSRDALKDPSCARAWLLTIVRREHARLYERKRLELVSLNDASEHEGSALLSQDDSEVQALRGAILRLPIEYREPLIMQVLGGFSVEEIAGELSLSASAVLTRLFRARNKLRVLYGMTPAADASGSEESP
jgi:RNA polymerase sigma-70 factor, ECF subfamily